ncbi:hypothetical protein ABOM_001828 [Aspergillus bombycis]|uniref:Bacteriophage T5 Orf172 DNA-binding domain-containing protein n=1 Tax=Aspergillus bombycis TaxID=109264 RepID=A0A1F8ADJ1_9EURO|nr:hypothetical protein ABOM_001828 [Aspergillus bombycis]OGM49752.1 hypothetical protein ABOM_001828 [Aspergillus bombycis]
MATKQTYFIPFDHLLPGEYTGQCAAYKINGKDRCRSNPRPSITAIKKLHKELQDSYRTGIDDDERETKLKKLAELTICGIQKKRIAGAIEDAIRQWNSELKMQNSPAVSPATPARNFNAQSKEDEGSSKLVFTPYKSANMDKYVADKLDQMADRKISTKSTTDSNKEKRDHLYIFECEDAKGMCKLGYSSNLSRRAREHEKCYPNVTERRSIYCPNADLFERVIQCELTQDRYKHKCGQCNTTHTEWFKADLDELYQRVKVWCRFSLGFQDPEKRVNVRIPSPGFSSDPDRWYKWAQEWVQFWENPVLHSMPNTPGKPVVNNAIVALEELNLEDDIESVPGLSPSSSASGMPDDDYIDPPTPTPIARSRNGKPVLGERLIIPAGSPSVYPEEYWTPVESMSTHKGRVLFPHVPGAYPASPVKVTPKKTIEDENGLADILENMTLR